MASTLIQLRALGGRDRPHSRRPPLRTSGLLFRPALLRVPTRAGPQMDPRCKRRVCVGPSSTDRSKFDPNSAGLKDVGELRCDSDQAISEHFVPFWCEFGQLRANWADSRAASVEFERLWPTLLRFRPISADVDPIRGDFVHFAAISATFGRFGPRAVRIPLFPRDVDPFSACFGELQAISPALGGFRPSTWARLSRHEPRTRCL